MLEGSHMLELFLSQSILAGQAENVMTQKGTKAGG